MSHFFKRFLFILSFLILLFAIYIAATTILSLNQLKQEIASENTPSDYHPLQILPPGVHPTPAIITTFPGQLTFTQKSLQGSALQSCLSNTQVIDSEGNAIITAAEQSVKTNTAIALGGQNYYTIQIVPQGKTLKNYDVLIADTLAKEKRTVSLIETLQSDVKDFNCNGSNPSMQITLISTDTTDTLNALHQYNTSVKNFITALSTIPDLGQSVKPVSSAITGMRERSNH